MFQRMYISDLTLSFGWMITNKNRHLHRKYDITRGESRKKNVYPRNKLIQTIIIITFPFYWIHPHVILSEQF